MPHIFIPGWATDGRVLRNSGIRDNFVSITHSSLWRPPRQDTAGTEGGIFRNALIVGWSLGGFLALDVTLRGGMRDCTLVLVGIRRRYPDHELRRVSHLLRTNTRAFLKRFYGDVFAGAGIQGPPMRRLIRDYMASYTYPLLRDSLDLFRKAEITPHKLARAGRVAVVHGERDRVAPFSEARDLASEAGVPFFGIPGAGHAAFLDQAFGEIIDDYDRC